MAIVTRYFDVGPFAQSIGAGIIGQIRYNAIKEQERKERERKRKKNWTVGAAAVGTALTAGLAAPALGLAGTAAATEIGTAAAIEAGGALAIPATAGILGTGGVVGLGGYLTAGALGAQAAQAFDRGDIASGLGAIAAPFAAEQGRKIARQERMGDFREMEGFRTDENIRQLLEAQNIQTYGATGGQIASMAAETEGRLPAAGTELLPADRGGYGALGPEPIGPEAVQAFGLPERNLPAERNLPGPGPVPGTKRDWTLAQNVARMKLMADYSETVENPDWISNHTPEDRAMRAQSIARALQNIRVTTLPDRPKLMLPGPGGKSVPAQLGVNTLPDGSKAILQQNGDLDYRDAPKDFTKNFTADWTPEMMEAYQRKQVGPDYDKLRAAGHSFFTQPDGKLVDIAPEKDTEGFKWDLSREIDAAQDQLLKQNKADAEYRPDRAETMALVTEKRAMLKDITDLHASLRAALAAPMFEGIDERQFAGLIRETERVYGPDRKKWPREVGDAILALNARLHPPGSVGLVTGRR